MNIQIVYSTFCTEIHSLINFKFVQRHLDIQRLSLLFARKYYRHFQFYHHNDTRTEKKLATNVTPHFDSFEEILLISKFKKNSQLTQFLCSHRCGRSAYSRQAGEKAIHRIDIWPNKTLKYNPRNLISKNAFQ